MTTFIKLGLLMFAFVASPVLAESRDTVPDRIVVRTADLDLRSDSGQKMLDRRLARAVIAACGTASNADLAGGNEVGRCLRVTGASLARERDQRIAAASTRPIVLAGR